MTTSQLKLMKKTVPRPAHGLATNLLQAIDRSAGWLLSQQRPDGSWWFTLEANETIGAGYIALTHYIDAVDVEIERAICRRILDTQRADGSWAIYYDGPPDLSNTIECYFALKLAGYEPRHPQMRRAQEAIHKMGGITKARVFTWIHLSLFGIVPWDVVPAMPIEMIHLPTWFPINIYEFSSWARASIVPLLVLMHQKKIRTLPGGAAFLDELFVEKNPQQRRYRYDQQNRRLASTQFFIWLDKAVKLTKKLPIKLVEAGALKKCEQWIVERQAKTTDIYPAMAYAIMAYHALGYEKENPILKKSLDGLKSFQQEFSSVLAAPVEPVGTHKHGQIHQQCCVSPIWDTPWTGLALVNSGAVKPAEESLIKTARWLVSKQIRDCHGDWAIKNPKTLPGGWAFEFENDYYPDVDDTIEVLAFLYKVDLPQHELRESFERGVNWLLSMQCKNGGWAAFDKDNMQEWINKIPFSDHGACLDPPTADVTGRMLEFLSLIGHSPSHHVIQKARSFILKQQTDFGGWEGRWGVNYIYGTWAAVCGLVAIGEYSQSPAIAKAVQWLKSVQRPDGGWGESPASYAAKAYVPLSESVPSQTAWALITLCRAEQKMTAEIEAATHCLMRSLGEDGQWSEKHFTGTGFPGYFFIRYHGYRNYFPLLALAEVRRLLGA